jgi:hypothetical protein
MSVDFGSSIGKSHRPKPDAAELNLVLRYLPVNLKFL